MLPVIVFWLWNDYKKSNYRISNKYILLLALISLTIFFSFLGMAFNGKFRLDDSSFTYVLFLELTEFLLSGYLMYKLVNSIWKGKIEAMFLIISLVTGIQALLIIYSFYSIEFREWVNNILPITGNIEGDGLLRMRGFTNSSGATLSIVQGIGFYFGLVLSIKEHNRKKKILYSLLCILQIFAILVCGRSGLIGVAFFVITMPILIYNKKPSDIIRVIVGQVTRVLLLISIVFFIIYSQLSTELKSVVQDQLIDYAFEPFIKGVKGQASDSQQDLQTMLILPNNIKTWLIGDSEYIMPNGANYMGSDSGYVKTIFFFGILGCIFFYSYKFYVIVYPVITIINPLIKRSLLLLGVYLLVFQIKEPFISKPEISKMLFAFFFMAVALKKKHNYLANES